MYNLWMRNVTLANSQEFCFYNDESSIEDFKIAAAKLSLEENSAGSLTISIPGTNVEWGSFEVFSTEVIVRKRTEYSIDKNIGDVYWIGRLLSSSEDYYLTKTLKFEGAYNYLMDTIQRQHTATTGVRAWLTYLITNHNKQCIANQEYYKIIKIGGLDPNLEPTTNPTFYTDYETTLECVNNVLEGWEGHMRFQYSNTPDTSFSYTEDGTTTTVDFGGEAYYLLTISVYKEYETGANNPEIIFGENLVDFTKENEVDEMATVIIPRGARYDDEGIAAVEASFQPGQTPLEDPNYPPIDGLEYYHTIYSVTNPHTIYLVTQDTTSLNRFGVVTKVVDFDLEDPNDLLAAGQKYLQDQKWINTNITISAIDAKLLGAETNEIKIGRMVHCLSNPHGLDYNYPCVAIDEDLMDISGTTYRLGIKDESYLSTSARRTDEKLRDLVMDSIRREKIVATNASNEIDNDIYTAFNDDTVFTATEIYNNLMEATVAGMDTAVDRATDIDKAYALNLLNIYDNDDNPNNKGYVHFKRINADYSGVVSVGDVRRRLKSVYPDWGSWIDQLMDTILFYWDNTDYIITMALGQQQNQVAISVWDLSYNDRANAQGDAYLKYNAVSKYFSGEYRWHTPSNAYYILSNGQLYGNSGIGTSSDYQDYLKHNPFGPNAKPQGSLCDRLIYPSEFNMNSEEFTFYCNRNVYSAQTGGTIVFTANFDKTEGSVGAPSDHIYEICISDNLDFTKGNVWRWNKSGLYFIKQGTYSTNAEETLHPENGEYQNPTDDLRIGITSDGSIVADRISVGVLNAGIIKAGYLTSQDYTDPNDPTADASFVLDINHGTMISRVGKLIFNSAGNNFTPTTSYCPKNEFLYMSNQELGLNAVVAGETSKKWMFILGSSFGVDSFGRCYMREGIIGATGNVWDLQAYNEDLITTRWMLQEGQTDKSHLVYDLKLNTTSARPVIKPAYRTDRKFNFWIRLATYDGTTLTFLTEPSDRIFFDAGSDSIFFNDADFNPPINYNGTPTEAEENQPAYYAGQLIPVFYVLNDETTSEDYYLYNGHKYVPQPFPNYLKVKSYLDNDSTKPQYVNYSAYSYAPSQEAIDRDNSGAVHVGSGYLYNGTIGTDHSFSLSGVNRTATIAVADGAGHSTTTRTDWRFTVGSKLGVTDDGTLYCYGAHMRSVDIDTTVSASYVDTNNVGGVVLNATQVEDGTEDSFVFTLDSSLMGSIHNGTIKMWLSSAQTYNSSTGTTTPIRPEPNSGPPDYTPSSGASIPQTAMYSNINFTLRVYKWFSKSGSSQVEKFSMGSYSFVYQKSTQTGYNGSNPQIFSFGDVSSWFEDIEQGGNIWNPTNTYETEVTVTNERSGDLRPTWVLSSYTGSSGSTGYNFGGTLVMAKQNANSTRPAMNVGARDIIASSTRWIGGPSKYWGHSYITTMHYRDAIQGSSSYLYKNTIEPLTDIYDTIFDELRPVSYYMNNAENRVKHTGFIMEEVGDILNRHHIDPEMFGAYAPNKDAEGGALCYLDFIALLTRQVQRLKSQVKRLEERYKDKEYEDSSDIETDQ